MRTVRSLVFLCVKKKFKEKSYECACFRKGRDDDIALQDWRVK